MRNRIHPVTETSGQARVNAKRRARAAFWAQERRTVRVRCSLEAEPFLRECIHMLGDRARIDGRDPEPGWPMVDLLVHIPGAPCEAVRAEPVFEAERRDGQYVPALVGIDWYGADGQRIDTVVAQ